MAAGLTAAPTTALLTAVHSMAAGPIADGPTPDGLTAVELDHVSAGYDARPALTDVSLQIPSGTLVAIFGPNGGGKTTLLKVVAGLLRSWSGTVEVLGAPPGREAHRVAYVPQAELVDWSFPVSVWDVAMMGRYPRLGPFRRPGAADREAVAAALEQVGMAGRARTQIGALSGGQRRRAFLARALAANPDLFLLDEPVTGVDVTTQEDLVGVLGRLAAQGRTVLATTHDLGAAAHHFERVIAVNRTIIASGPASLVLDTDVLSRTFGGHLLEVRGRTIIIDEAHHHDSEAPGEHHHHDSERSSRP
ncbi:MAG TPA: metal ABC transporter ATP-binding protein [Candidatus Saccharimonadales bacterium]|nr:metal ABC transporter ATP-binding protein [Candidatus Saccharimonadales bacterium]